MLIFNFALFVLATEPTATTPSPDFSSPAEKYADQRCPEKDFDNPENRITCREIAIRDFVNKPNQENDVQSEENTQEGSNLQESPEIMTETQFCAKYADNFEKFGLCKKDPYTFAAENNISFNAPLPNIVSEKSSLPYEREEVKEILSNRESSSLQEQYSLWKTENDYRRGVVIAMSILHGASFVLMNVVVACPTYSEKCINNPKMYIGGSVASAGLFVGTGIGLGVAIGKKIGCHIRGRKLQRQMISFSGSGFKF